MRILIILNLINISRASIWQKSKWVWKPFNTTYGKLRHSFKCSYLIIEAAKVHSSKDLPKSPSVQLLYCDNSKRKHKDHQAKYDESWYYDKFITKSYLSDEAIILRHFEVIVEHSVNKIDRIVDRERFSVGGPWYDASVFRTIKDMHQLWDQVHVKMIKRSKTKVMTVE